MKTKWGPINLSRKDQEIEYLFIDNEVKVITKPFADRLKFWDSFELSY